MADVINVTPYTIVGCSHESVHYPTDRILGAASADGGHCSQNSGAQQQHQHHVSQRNNAPPPTIVVGRGWQTDRSTTRCDLLLAIDAGASFNQQVGRTHVASITLVTSSVTHFSLFEVRKYNSGGGGVGGVNPTPNTNASQQQQQYVQVPSVQSCVSAVLDSTSGQSPNAAKVLVPRREVLSVYEHKNIFSSLLGGVSSQIVSAPQDASEGGGGNQHESHLHQQLLGSSLAKTVTIQLPEPLSLSGGGVRYLLLRLACAWEPSHPLGLDGLSLGALSSKVNMSSPTPGSQPQTQLSTQQQWAHTASLAASIIGAAEESYRRTQALKDTLETVLHHTEPFGNSSSSPSARQELFDQFTVNASGFVVKQDGQGKEQQQQQYPPALLNTTHNNVVTTSPSYSSHPHHAQHYSQHQQILSDASLAQPAPLKHEHYGAAATAHANPYAPFVAAAGTSSRSPQNNHNNTSDIVSSHVPATVGVSTYSTQQSTNATEVLDGGAERARGAKIPEPSYGTMVIVGGDDTEIEGSETEDEDNPKTKPGASKTGPVAVQGSASTKAPPAQGDETEVETDDDNDNSNSMPIRIPNMGANVANPYAVYNPLLHNNTNNHNNNNNNNDGNPNHNHSNNSTASRGSSAAHVSAVSAGTCKNPYATVDFGATPLAANSLPRGSVAAPHGSVTTAGNAAPAAAMHEGTYVPATALSTTCSRAGSTQPTLTTTAAPSVPNTGVGVYVPSGLYQPRGALQQSVSAATPASTAAPSAASVYVPASVTSSTGSNPYASATPSAVPQPYGVYVPGGGVVRSAPSPSPSSSSTSPSSTTMPTTTTSSSAMGHHASTGTPTTTTAGAAASPTVQPIPSSSTTASGGATTYVPGMTYIPAGANAPQTVSAPSVVVPPTGKPLSGVVFLLSGFVNPLRSQLRDGAVALGAQCLADWDPNTCTHLVTVSSTTPKYNQVVLYGTRPHTVHIVSEKWLLAAIAGKVRPAESAFSIGLGMLPPLP